MQRAAVERECTLLDRLPHPLGEGDAGIRHRAGKEDHELLAAVSADPVDLARLGAQDIRELAKDRVTGLVAVGVVDALELVEIAHDARQRLAEARGVGEHVVQ